MQILRDDAVAMCVGLDYATAGSWNRKKMRKMLKQIAELGGDSELEVEEGTEDAERLNALLAGVIEAGGDVEVVRELDESPDEPDPVAEGEVDAVAEEEATEPEAEEADDPTDEDLEAVEKPKPKKGKAKGEAVAKGNPPAEKDKFGFRKGATASVFWACVSRKPKSIKELVEQSGVKQQRGYAKGLCSRGLVVKEDGKYKLPV